jgi:hypothetical protein
VGISADVNPGRRELLDQRSTVRPSSPDRRGFTLKDPDMVEQAELHHPAEPRLGHRPTEAEARGHLRGGRHPQPTYPAHDVLVPRCHAEPAEEPVTVSEGSARSTRRPLIGPLPEPNAARRAAPPSSEDPDSAL